MDIESYFNSIDHETLIALVKRWIEKMAVSFNNPAIHGGDEQKAKQWQGLQPFDTSVLFPVAKTIITHNPTHNVIYTGDKEKLKKIPPGKSYFNNPPGRGLPLGNLSSQFFANIYLHELDWFVKSTKN